MKKIVFTAGIVLSIISCTDKKDQPAVTEGESEMVEIPFTKEGELEFINQNGEAFKKIDIEIAETENERATGLMYRSKMDENKGMLFLFDDNEVRKHTFYMKNTRIPLDIMYFSPDSILINIARNAQPGADAKMSGGTVDGAAADSKFVVEINGGLADQWGIKDGVTKIRWTRN
jgi:uncharacterized membrane protein (UPF0127 family)